MGHPISSNRAIRLKNEIASRSHGWKPPKRARVWFGGDDGIRTHDLCSAIAALSQLSYIPTGNESIPAPRRVRRAVPASGRPTGRIARMTVDDVMAELKSLGNEKVRAQNARNGAGENQFGVKMGDLRAIAKRIKTDHELALGLWKTGNIEARQLATLILKPKLLSADEIDQMVREVSYGWLADWLMTNVVKPHQQKEELRQKWMSDPHPSAARAGWSLTTERVGKSPDGLNLAGLLDRIEKEMADASDYAKWTMNFCLIEIGLEHPEHRQRAIAIGEKAGAYRDYPVSKGCTSPFAPIAITELAARKG